MKTSWKVGYYCNPEPQDQKTNTTLPIFRAFLVMFNIKGRGCSIFLFYFLKWSGLTLLKSHLSLKTKCLGVTVWYCIPLSSALSPEMGPVTLSKVKVMGELPPGEVGEAGGIILAVCVQTQIPLRSLSQFFLSRERESYMLCFFVSFFSAGLGKTFPETAYSFSSDFCGFFWNHLA